MEDADLDGVASEEATLQPPFGLVVLPTAWLDRCDERWLAVLRDNPRALTVNLAVMSSRLRKAGALPQNHVAIDNPKVMGSREERGWDLAVLERAYRDVKCVWGGYDFWIRKNRIRQAKACTAAGEQLPEWCSPARVGPDPDGIWTFAGQYTSCCACNIAAYLAGWVCTVLVLGNAQGGAYCDLEGVDPKWAATKNSRGTHWADHHQWRWLSLCARDTATRIVHVGDSPCRAVPRVSAERALEAVLCR